MNHCSHVQFFKQGIRLQASSFYHHNKRILHHCITFVWSPCEQVLVLSLLSTSDHHTGQTSLHSGRLLRRLSGEVLNTQVIIPGLGGTQRTRPAVHWGRGNVKAMWRDLDYVKKTRTRDTYYSLLYQAVLTASCSASPTASWSFCLVWNEPAHSHTV